jgi:hypothetical protein
MLRPWPFPWRQPASHYDDDGPREQTTVTFEGVELLVTPTREVGVHTARTRFRVECLRCTEVLHVATTGPSSYIREHLGTAHDVQLHWEPWHRNLTDPRA